MINKTIKYLGLDYEIVGEDTFTISIKRGDDVILIDKSSDRYLALYKEDFDFILDTPDLVKVDHKKQVKLRKKAKISDLILYLKSLTTYKRLVAIQEILLKDEKYERKLKLELLVFLEEIVDSKGGSTSEFKTWNLGHIKNILGEYNMSKIREELELAKKHLDKAFNLLEGTEDQGEGVEKSSFDIARVVESCEWEDILQALKNAGVKFRLTEKLKGLEGKDAIKWLENLIKEDKIEEDDLYSLLEDLGISEDDDNEDEDEDTATSEDDDDEDDDDEDDDDEDDDDEDDISDLPAEDILELAKTADIEFSKKLKKAVKKGKDLDDDLLEELESLKEEIQETLQGDDEKESDEDEDSLTLEEAEKVFEEYDSFIDFVEDCELEEVFDKKMIKTLEKLFDEDTLSELVEKINNALDDEDIELVKEEIEDL
jgi:hypothetical protein